MYRRELILGATVAILFLLSGVCNSATAAGDTLAQFVEKELDDAVRVSFFEPEYINWSRTTPPKNLIPDNKSEKTAVRPTVSYGELGEALECDEIRLASWNDWQAEVKAHEHDKNWDPAYQYWNSPSYIRVRTSRKYLILQDWPVRVSIAIISENFDIYRVFDRRSGALRSDVLGKMKKLTGRAYFLGRGHLLDDAAMEVVAKTKCDGFSIFNLTFRR